MCVCVFAQELGAGDSIWLPLWGAGLCAPLPALRGFTTKEKTRGQAAQNPAQTRVLLEGSAILPSPGLGEKLRDN